MRASIVLLTTQTAILGSEAEMSGVPLRMSLALLFARPQHGGVITMVNNLHPSLAHESRATSTRRNHSKNERWEAWLCESIHMRRRIIQPVWGLQSGKAANLEGRSAKTQWFDASKYTEAKVDGSRWLAAASTTQKLAAVAATAFSRWTYKYVWVHEGAM